MDRHNKKAIRERQRKLLIQKLMGIGFLVLSVFVMLLAMSGQTVEERDCTAILFTLPMALCLIFSRSVLIY